MLDKEFIKKLLTLYPNYTNVTGPYLRKDKRKHIVLNNSKLPSKHPDKLRTLSYPKALVEVKENRILEINETVDHIDEDCTNNDLDNLQILTRSENISKTFEVNNKHSKIYKGVCPVCNNVFTKMLNDVIGNRKKGKAGPFCSRSCAGKCKFMGAYPNRQRDGS